MNVLAEAPFAAVTTGAPAGTIGIEGALHIPLARLRPSPTNPRRHFDEKKLAELAESIAKHGVMQPILVRPQPLPGKVDEQLFEIVAGERRWRASRITGQPNIMAIVRAMTDFEVIELQLIENLQRDDLHPLEEADGYARLLRTEGAAEGYSNVDELASRIGKSRSYVFQRLKLRALHGPAREAFAAGQVHATVALLLARLHSAEEQQRALEGVLHGGDFGEPMTFREASDWIQREFYLALDRATFKISDATLVPAAGSCKECPKRTGANPDLFADVKKGDTCTDAACYHAKEAAQRQRVLEQARADSKEVITGAEAKKIKPRQYEQPKGYLELDMVHHELGEKPLRKLLGKHVPQVSVLEDPYTKTLVEVVRETDAIAVLKERGVLKQAKKHNAALSDAERKAKAETTWRHAVAQACTEAAGTHRGADLDYRQALLTRVAQLLWHELQFDSKQRVHKLLAWPALRAKWQEGPGPIADTHIAGLTDAQLCQYFTVATLVQEIHVAYYNINGSNKPERLLAAAKALGVDPAAIREQLRALERVPGTAAAKVKNKTATTPGQRASWPRSWTWALLRLREGTMSAPTRAALYAPATAATASAKPRSLTNCGAAAIAPRPRAGPSWPRTPTRP